MFIKILVWQHSVNIESDCHESINERKASRSEKDVENSQGKSSEGWLYAT